MRSVSGAAEVGLTDWLRLRARYLHERSTDRTVHTATLALRQTL